MSIILYLFFKSFSCVCREKFIINFLYFLNYRTEKIHPVIHILYKIIYYLATNAPANNGSTLIPGPIVNEIATVLKYCPFEVAGFNLII